MELKLLKILVVDDVDPMRKLTCSVLQKLGVGSVLEAKNGEEAFKIFVVKKPDIVIADWEMEPVNGLELTQKIRSQASPENLTPVLLMTGYDSSDRINTAFQVGVNEFLIKPFNAKDMAKALTKIIQGPQDLIKTESYYGPNRRLHPVNSYTGTERRKSANEDSHKRNAS